MKNINWAVRLKNKMFWVAMIPAALLLVQSGMAVFGVHLDLGALGDRLLTVVNSAFVVLTITGVVTDPTTKGVSDSIQALKYEEPR